MSLYLTLAAAPDCPALPSGRQTEEVVVDTAQVLTGAQLRGCLGDRFRVNYYSVGGQPVESLSPGTPPLTNGAVVVASGKPGTRAVRRAATARPPLVFLVRSGPDAGQLTALTRGTYSIGRSGSRITIRDPELSRNHATLTVDDNHVTLRDNDSVNGVRVDGRPVAEATLTVDSIVLLGNSVCGIALPDQHPPPDVPADLSNPVEVHAPPPAERNRLLLITALLPVILGVVLALTTGMWFFLAFSALSALTGLVPWVSGRRRRRRFEAAAAQAARVDEARRRRAAPDAGTLALAAAQAMWAGHGQRDRVHPQNTVWYLRLGLADLPADLSVNPSGAEWKVPELKAVPLTVPLKPDEGAASGTVEIGFLGSTPTLLGAARYLLLQLCGSAGAAQRTVCVGHPGSLPAGAQYLPGVTVVSDLQGLGRSIASGSCDTVLMFGSAADGEVPGYHTMARIFRFGATPFSSTGVTVTLSSGSGRLRAGGLDHAFLPDLLSSRSFERAARLLGGMRGAAVEAEGASAVPESVSLTELLPRSDPIGSAWDGGAGSGSGDLCAPIGRKTGGNLDFDLVSDGPHLLVAGTTGSGKSELLRTLVLSMALHHSPAEVNFLLVDFKGGSGLGGLASLPHCVGLQTDLSAEMVSRALESLKAEVRRRERLFAASGVTDLAEYRAGSTGVGLPRLVVVIDEFRMLAEDVPGAVQDLMRVATLGRSLGIHLVLATQRPQGAVSSDIRTNITASISLRVQTPAESMDVIGSAIASDIPVAQAGRAYLRVGSGPTVEFQTASTAVMRNSPPAKDAVVRFNDFLPASGDGPDTRNPPLRMRRRDTPSGIDGLVTRISVAAGLVDIPSLHRPVMPPLPAAIGPTRSAANGTPGAAGLELGVLDLPAEQSQQVLRWNPAGHSHLALVGQPAGGTTGVLTHITGRLLVDDPQRHLYLLDGDGSLSWARGAPQTGAHAGGHELKRAARIVERISELISERLAAGSAGGAVPTLALIISNWGRWTGGFRHSRWARAEETLLDLVRDGEAAGVTVVITGERDLLAARFFPLLPNRIFLPLGIGPESVMSWPKLPSMDPVVGRGMVQGRMGTAQGAVAQLALNQAAPVRASPGSPLLHRPFRVEPLPALVHSSSLDASDPNCLRSRIPIGLSGDELDTAWLELPPRSVHLILGGPRSGRSTLLDHVRSAAPHPLVCCRPPAGVSPDRFWTDFSRHPSPGPAVELLLLVDDADQLSPETHHHLGALASAGARVILAALTGPSLASRVPLAMQSRSAATGIVLAPKHPSDGDFFGVRLECEGRALPGRGFLVNGGEVTEIQTAFPTPPGHGNTVKRHSITAVGRGSGLRGPEHSPRSGSGTR